MATSYRYQRAGDQHGPVDFRELVRLVREESLVADDLVIADWQKEWGPAAEVIGLFHTAGRADVLVKWEAEQKDKRRRQLLNEQDGGDVDLTDIEKMLQAEGSLHSSPSALDRIEQVEAEQRAALRSQQQASSQAGSDQNVIEKTVDSAVAELDERDQRRKQKSIVSFLTVGTVQSIFRMSMAIGLANLVAYFVLSWSQTELQRFPESRVNSAQVRVFPIYGKCSQSEFLFLMFDTMVFSGIAGYGIARGLEFFVDE